MAAEKESRDKASKAEGEVKDRDAKIKTLE